MLPIFALSVMLSHFVLGYEEDHYVRLNEWSEEPYVLDLLRVQTYSDRSRIQCCALCSQDQTCFGSAWNIGSGECKLASNVGVMAYVELAPVDKWEFMVKEEFICGSEICLTYQTSCEGVRDLGVSRSGVYTVNFSSYELGLHDVSCDMVNGGGGWMVFQRRENGDQSFKKGWQDYADGFGNVKSEFWLGNDLLHEITASTPHELRVDLEDFEGNFAFAEYSTFLIKSVEKRYQLLCGGYSGNAGDSLANQNEMFFTTIDMDNDRATENCAVLFHGAWWHNSCHECNLNGDYLGGSHESYADGIEWKGFTGLYYSLKFTEMKLRQRSPE